MPATIFAANESSVLLAGKAIDGVRSVEYRQQRSRASVYSLGRAERIGVVSGPMSVEVRVRVATTSPELDALDPETPFELSAQLQHGTEALTVSFHECYLLEKSLELGVGGHGETQYSFTAVRIEETKGTAETAA